MKKSSIEPTAPIQARWLVRLRWAAIAAQVSSLLGVRFLLDVPFPLWPTLPAIGLLALMNFVVAFVLERNRVLTTGFISGNLLIDIAVLTFLLGWTGGAMNPFTTLYLLHVALAALLLPPRWSLLIAMLAAAAFGVLLLVKPEAVHVWHSGRMFMLHVQGMWIAFALTATALWFFINRTSTALRLREIELANAKIEAIQAERLVAIGALAAGAAHELNTPLGTVAILASELSDMLQPTPALGQLADEIRAQVRRCTAILARLRSPMDSTESLETVNAYAWTNEMITRWGSEVTQGKSVVTVHCATALQQIQLQIVPTILQQALYNVLDNAHRAGVGLQPMPAIEVTILWEIPDQVLAIEITDHGPGMDPHIVARVGEPFLTTRSPGEGLGLGLFLTQIAVQQHHGKFSVRSNSNGTTVRFALPVSNRELGLA